MYAEILFPTAYFGWFDSDGYGIFTAKTSRRHFQTCDPRFVFLEIGRDQMCWRAGCIRSRISNKDDHRSVTFIILRVEVQGNFWIPIDVTELVRLCLTENEE